MPRRRRDEDSARVPDALQREAKRNAAAQIRDSASFRNRGPGSAAHHSVLRRARDTDQTMTSASLTRIGAMVRRYWYLLRSSWPRILDLIYWPTVQMLMWGFLQTYVASAG